MGKPGKVSEALFPGPSFLGSVSSAQCHEQSRAASSEAQTRGARAAGAAPPPESQAMRYLMIPFTPRYLAL